MTAPTSTLTVRWTDLADPLVRPLLDELAYEYATRYQGILAVDQIRDELEHYPAAEFAAPDGALVLLLEDGEPGGGRRVPSSASSPSSVTPAVARVPRGATRPGSRRSPPRSSSGSGPITRTAAVAWPRASSPSWSSAPRTSATRGCT